MQMRYSTSRRCWNVAGAISALYWFRASSNRSKVCWILSGQYSIYRTPQARALTRAWSYQRRSYGRAHSRATACSLNCAYILFLYFLSSCGSFWVLHYWRLIRWGTASELMNSIESRPGIEKPHCGSSLDSCCFSFQIHSKEWYKKRNISELHTYQNYTTVYCTFCTYHEQ